MLLGHDFIDYCLVNDNEYSNVKWTYYCDDYDVSINYDCKKCKTLASRERAKDWARSHDITVSDTTQEICKCKILSKSVSTQTDTEEIEETEIPTKTLILEVFRLLGVIIGRFVRSMLVFLMKLVIVVAIVTAMLEVALVIWQGPDVPREGFRVTQSKYGSTIDFQGPFIWRCIYGVWCDVFMDEFHA